MKLTSYQRLKAENKELQKKVNQLECSIMQLVNEPESSGAAITTMWAMMNKKVEDQLMQGDITNSELKGVTP
jgi:hypothetical protein